MSEIEKKTAPQESQPTSMPQPAVAGPVASLSADQAADKMRRLGVNLTTVAIEAERADPTEVAFENTQPPNATRTNLFAKPPENK
jgi:hypothetical protein